MNTKPNSPFLTRLARITCLLFIFAGCVQCTNHAGLSKTAESEEPSIEISETTSLPDTASLPSARDSLTEFGLLTVLPESTGSTFSPQAISANAATNVRYMRVALEWAISESLPGQITFDSRNDKIIANIEKEGLSVFPTLYVGRGWMNGNPIGKSEGGSRSYPPDDLSDQWDDRYGYSPGYYNFIYTFFSHYRGHFEYVAIENEANSKLFWGGSAEDYVRLLKTAYHAIKAADPQVIVVDSGFVSIALGLCIAGDYLENGLKTPDEILKFAVDYYSGDTGKIKISNANDLEQALNRPQVQEQCRRINFMLDHMANAVDAVNFHFYEDYRTLPVVVEWLQLRSKEAGYNPIFISNEMGIRGLSTSFAESPAHAIEVFKKMITAMSLDLRAVVWFSTDTIQAGKDKVGLFDNAGQMRMAGNTMMLVIDTLGSGYQLKEVSSSGPILYHYLFGDSRGVSSVEAVWVEGTSQFLQIDAPAGASQAVIVDYSGESYALAVEENHIGLVCGNAPVFVVWE